MSADHGSIEADHARHVPVLLAEVLAALQPAAGKTFIDGTFGAGGYTTALLNAGADVIAIDRDPDAIATGQTLVERAAGRLRLVQDVFSNLDAHAGLAGGDGLVDGIVLDVGVSSMQLDQAERGFSFRGDGPLDMRMAQSGNTAADVVNTYKTTDLIRIFGILGEEKQSSRIARMIEQRRAVQPFERTRDLANAIETLVGRNPKVKIHPATRCFQGLRIFVNDELGELAKALFAAERVLKPGGVLAVVSFHSLEDRIVKRFLADRSTQSGGSRHLPAVNLQTLTFERPAPAVSPSEAEEDTNPRARSARLRSARRTDADPRPADFSLFGLPRLPDIQVERDR
ncbi:16S rRNA (cytosine(1402)-N(4))-methyltransferase RsmH [Tianweitania sp. BSSL-BM11]|uniref:Ribosomal RNA small subunit methyltransferase H n=1 Tax=Tianweitania aestuarii TaxID=2814886 RepID=A0ABS5RXH4_9HYPH|nr:16S rRNA (cytosine(1402)-N(4))-methyltransferase RsmH [Tianweitania aestuarii]MBS9720929.1 16S rRNA (cytosine(1402)-N(4))-methyltransferase RsmH [Tianweitania aestuarii]